MAINRVTIMGNLTRDAELRKKGDATSVLTFGLAINEKKKDSETGEYVDAPVFLTLTVSVVFGNVAAAVFAVCSALSVTVGYGLVRASDSRE